MCPFLRVTLNSRFQKPVVHNEHNDTELIHLYSVSVHDTRDPMQHFETQGVK